MNNNCVRHTPHFMNSKSGDVLDLMYNWIHYG